MLTLERPLAQGQRDPIRAHFPLKDGSEIELDIAGWFRAADQHVSSGRRSEWIGRILDSASDQRALAGMADPCAA